LYVWHEAEKIIKAHPWTGVGLENFELAFEQARESQLSGTTNLYDDAHNLFLHLFAELGIPAALIFLILISLPIFFGLRRFWLSKSTVALGLIAALASYLVTAQFTPVPLSLWLLLAVVICALSWSDGIEKAHALKKYSRFIIAIFGGLLVIWAILFFSAELIFFQGSSAYHKSDYNKARSLFRLATRLNPTEQEFLFYEAYGEVYAQRPAEEVIQTIDKFQSLHPLEERVYRHGANLYFLLYERTDRKEYLVRAIGNMRTSMNFDPESSLRYLYLFRYYFQSGILDSAKASLKQGLVYNSQDFRSWLLLARVYQQEGDRTKTLAALQRAYENNPNELLTRLLLRRARTEKDIKALPLDIPISYSGLD
jgi:tetratricopeptide (TPR) repeat protein